MCAFVLPFRSCGVLTIPHAKEKCAFDQFANGCVQMCIFPLVDGTTTSNLQRGENPKKRKLTKGLPSGPPKLHPSGIQCRRMYGEGDKHGGQTTHSATEKEMGQGICGGVRICKSTPIVKTGKIVLAPTKGRKGEERRRRVAQGITSRRQNGDAADGPLDEKVENKGGL